MQIQIDGLIDIATGRSRKETNWKNKEILWSQLVSKLSTTHRTAETYGEYISSKKTRQDEIKDIGGFVGGFLTGGRRKATSVIHRQLLTLDIDYGEPGVWEDFQLCYDNAAAVYSTHKHSPEAPRYRLILPLDRPVFPDEYTAIARRIAGVIGIELFDHTTFEPSRLMYWPSTPKDAEFIFDYQDGPWLIADDILASYRDWKDSSEWPVSQRNYNIIQRDIKKQGDPLEKPGVVGAFCRTYSISETIENFLSDVYEPCDMENRYTFKEGSTAAGLVVYDDKYAFSHHGTDPTSGKLCNAFDLVRLHHFSLKDEEVKEGTPGNKLPSYEAMVAFATKDANVRIQLTTEKISNAKTDFAQAFKEEDNDAPVSDDWKAQLGVDRKGNFYNTIDNAVLFLENDPWLRNNIAYDKFEQRAIARRNLPWRKITPATKYLTDRDDDNLVHYLETTYQFSPSKISLALSVIYERHSFHPVVDYLKSLVWDGQERLEEVLIDYLGAEDSEYVRAVTRKTLVAAVSRVFQPGIKFDYLLTLVGKQGVYKSSLFDKLGREWFSDSFSTVQGKEAYEQIQGVWIVEMGELAGLKKADVESIKHYISKRVDRYRVAYGKRVENFPRQCIFIGSTNKLDFLRDPTGNRRFWPIDLTRGVPVKHVFEDLSADEVNQIWAEAVKCYKGYEPLYLPAELEQVAIGIQKEHSEYDERAGLIQRYLDTKLPLNWEELGVYERRAYLSDEADLKAPGVTVRQRVCAAEIWCEVLGGLQKDMSSHNTKELHNIMRNMEGWEEFKSRTVFGKYGNQKGYYRLKNHTTANEKTFENTTASEK